MNDMFLANEELYSLGFERALKKATANTGYFVEAFGQPDIIDGVTNNDEAFIIKKGPRTVRLNKYDTGENVGMGDKSAGYSRFGPINERKYVNKPVLYDGTYSMNEGIDMLTVNADPNKAIAEILAQYSRRLTQEYNKKKGIVLSEKAGKDFENYDMSAEGLTDLFTDAYIYFTNSEFLEPYYAYVTPDVYSKLVDLNLIQNVLKTTAGNVDVGRNSLSMFKNFNIVSVPEAYMGDSKVIFTLSDIGMFFVGYSSIRVLDRIAEYEGAVVQATIKDGYYVPDDNEVAIARVTLKGLDGETLTRKAKSTKTTKNSDVKGES